MVFGVCRRMIGDHHLAEDAFQAVFVVLARRAEIVRPTELPQWLYGTAYRVARRARAMAARRQTRERTGMILPESAQHDRHVDDVAELLDDAISQLSPTLRDAVVLCELDGLSRADAAKKLGIAEGTLSSRLAAGRKKLAELLRNKQITMPTGALIAATAVPTSLLTAAVESSAPAVVLSATVRTLVHGALAMSLVKKTALSTVAILTVMVAGAGWSSSPKEEPNRPSRSTLTAAPIPKQSTWERFKAICGDSPKAKKLYEEMLGDEAEAKELFEADATEAAAFKVYIAKATELTKARDDAFREFAGMARRDDRVESPLRKKSLLVVSRKALLRTLFLGSRTVPMGSIDTDSVTAFVLSATMVDLASEEDAEPVRKLYAAWLKARKSTKAKSTGISFGLYVISPELLPIAREWSADEKLDPKILMNCLLLLGNHGDDSDYSRILKFRSDERIASESTYRDAAKNFELKLTLQLRDIAAGMALTLGKQEVKSFGFHSIETIAWWLGPDPAPFVSLTPFGNEAHRDAAHVKAKPWIEQKLKELKEKDKKPELTAVWNRFKAITGDTAEAKALFDEMTADPADAKRLVRAVESEEQFFETYETMCLRSNDQFNIEYVQKKMDAQSQRLNERSIDPSSDLNFLISNQVSSRLFSKSKILQMMFLGTSQKLNGAIDPKLSPMVFESSYFFSLFRGAESIAFRKLLMEWIRRRQNISNYPLIVNAISSLRGIESQEILDWARSSLDEDLLIRKSEVRIRGGADRLLLVECALMVIGQSTDQADTRRLMEFLDDQRPVWRSKEMRQARSYGEEATHEIRDDAWFWLLLKHGRMPSDYGFPIITHELFQGNQEPRRVIQPRGFHRPADREAMLAIAKPWLARLREKMEKPATAKPRTIDELRQEFRRVRASAPSANPLFDRLVTNAEEAKSLGEAMADNAAAFDAYHRLAQSTQTAISRVITTLSDSNPPRVTPEDHERYRRLTDEAMNRAVPAMTVVKLLFLGTRPIPPSDLDPRIVRLMNQPFIDRLMVSPESDAIRPLIVSWLKARRNVDTIETAVEGLLRFPQLDLGSLARSWLGDAKQDPVIVSVAMAWIRQSGTKSDFSSLLLFADDRRPYLSIAFVSPYQRTQTVHELRDLAVVSAMIVSDIDPTTFGFRVERSVTPRPAGNVRPLFDIKPFATAQIRDAAHAKAKAWIEAQKR